MTFIISAANEGFTLQVSDRLLSEGKDPFDEYTNKSVLVRTLRGLVSVTYTGPSFLLGQRVDHIIAQEAVGYRELREGTMSQSVGLFASAPSVGTLLVRLRERLWSYGAWRNRGGAVVVTGWQWRLPPRSARPVGSALLRQYRPVVYTLKGAQPTLTSHLKRIPPRLTSMRVRFAGSGVDAMTPHDHARLKETLNPLGPGNLWGVERGLVDFLREISQRHDGVGGDCLSIAMSPHNDILRCSYFPWEPQSAPWNYQELPSHAFFTPWIISGRTAVPPTRTTMPGIKIGGLSVDFGGSYQPPLDPKTGAMDLADLDFSPVAGPTPAGWRPMHGAWRAPEPHRK
jgi:hypothetical protein